MKKILVITLLLCVYSFSYAQKTKLVNLANEQMKLNSKTHLGGVNRTYITLQVPPYTRYLYLTISSAKTGQPTAAGLLGQLSELLPGNAVNDIAALADATQRVSGYTMQGVVNFNLMTSMNAARMYMNGASYIQSIPAGNRANFAGGTVGVPIEENILPQTFYLGIRNPQAIDAEFVSIEAVAVVRTFK